MAEMVPVIARPPVEKIAPSRGVIKVVPQVGQPAPRAISPVIIPALLRLSTFCLLFLFHSRTINPIKVPCRREIRKIGSQSKKGWLTPKMLTKFFPRILKHSGKPSENIKLNFEVPPDSKFIKSPNNKKAGIKPYQKRLSFVARRMPFPARRKSSNHFLQFIIIILT